MTFNTQAAQICAVTNGADTRIAMKAALDEIERLQRIISEPVESFGTPELIAWAERLQKILSDFPEEERGQIPFALTMGSHLEKFAKSWNSPVMQAQARRIAELELILSQSKRVIADLQKTNAELGEESQKRYGRVVELNAAVRVEKSAHEETKYADSEAANQTFSQITKQRAALKKLGQAKRARGKVLVEERARRTHSDQRGSSCDYHESDECGATWRNFCDFVGCPHKNEFVALARKQLRPEKLL